MTSRDRPTNRRVVFERDGYACRHCGEERTTPRAGDGAAETNGDGACASDTDALRAYRVGPEPAAIEGPVHEDLLVAVCAECFRTLHPDRERRFAGADGLSRRALFDAVREFTREQSGAVSTAAAFASTATQLPETVEREGIGAFPDARREALLAVDVVDARLERLRSLPEPADDDVEARLEEFLESATALQTELRTVAELGGAVPAGVGRCHGCFADLADRGGDACPTCGLEGPALEEWRIDGRLRFDRLFGAITDALEAAIDRTEAVTDRSVGLAETLVDA